MSDPFTPSPELAAIARRWLLAYAGRDRPAVVNLFSGSDAVTYIGSADGEILTGDDYHQTFAAFTDDQVALVPEDLQATGYEAGEIGWAWTTLTIVSPDAGKSVKFRNTFIFHLDEGVWRIVHIHNSNPKPNMEAMGYASQSLDKLAEMTREARIDIGQTGIASIMFTDIADSTALAETLGDGPWRQIVSRHMDAVGALVTNAGGKLLKSLGDGTLSSFPTASAALKAAVGIQRTNAASSDEPRLRLRIGVHTGDVVEDGGDVLGTVVNKAARVAALAAPDEIVVTDATRLMVGGVQGLAFGDPASVTLKGLEGDHLIHRLAWRE